jgi:type III pantothenate kinase
MKPDVVVDVGNSRIKWGRCLADHVAATASLAADPGAEWEDQCKNWRIGAAAHWVVSGVDPSRRDALVQWIERRGGRVIRLNYAKQLPLRVALEEPDRVGIDRLLNAVAARHRCPIGRPAIIVDAGSAVTVDWLDEAGAFAGGAIFPGERLMAKALHEHTALLPLVSLDTEIPPFPGTSTVAAMRAGIFFALSGGVRALIERLCSEESLAEVFITGGDGPLISKALPISVISWPEMTLEGIRLSAEAIQEK